MNKNRLLPHASALFSAIIWGSTFVSSSIVLNVLSPIQLMTIRFLTAYLVLVILHPIKQKISAKEEAVFLLLGLFGCTLYFLSENTALTLTYSANVSLIVAVAPILTILLSLIFFKESRSVKYILIGSFISFVGVVLVVFNGSFLLKINPLGDFLAFLSGLCWAIYSLILRKVVDKHDNLLLNRKIMFYGFITSIPLVFIENRAIDYAELFQVKIIFNILFLGVLGSALCYISWNSAVKKLGVLYTNSYIYLIPFVTMTAAHFFLQESITLYAIAGALFITSGLIIAGLKDKKLKEDNKISA